MFRVGIGWDVHRLVEGEELHLGGVHFPKAAKGLEGHSDADVVCHAICDALLGAAALGDIGEHFPDNDPQYKGYPGGRFLERVRTMVNDAGYSIENVDCTVMSDAVRLGTAKKERTRIGQGDHVGRPRGRRQGRGNRMRSGRPGAADKSGIARGGIAGGSSPNLRFAGRKACMLRSCWQTRNRVAYMPSTLVLSE